MQACSIQNEITYLKIKSISENCVLMFTSEILQKCETNKIYIILTKELFISLLFLF